MFVCLGVFFTQFWCKSAKKIWSFVRQVFFTQLLSFFSSLFVRETSSINQVRFFFYCNRCSFRWLSFFEYIVFLRLCASAIFRSFSFGFLFLFIRTHIHADIYTKLRVYTDRNNGEPTRNLLHLFERIVWVHCWIRRTSRDMDWAVKARRT